MPGRPICSRSWPRREELYRELALAASNEPVEIYLFANAEAISGYRQRYCRGLSTRRAFFVQTAERLAVYAQWSDRLPEDLRHETTHAFLHAVIPDPPLWLDEGLAVYYETPRGSRGLNPQHLRWLAAAMAGPWHPDLHDGAAPPDDRHAAGGLRRSLGVGPFPVAVASGVRRFVAALPGRHGRGGQAKPLSARLHRTLANPDATLLEYVRSLLAGSG